MTEVYQPRTWRDGPGGARRTGPLRLVRLVGAREDALSVGRSRLAFTAVLFIGIFTLLAGRLMELSLLRGGEEPAVALHAATGALHQDRVDILDRNGVLLASNLQTASLYADARLVPDPGQAADRLLQVLPGIDRQTLVARLGSGRSFVWLKRDLTPRQQYAVNRLGIPGLNFQHSQRRIYPHGRLFAHVLGFTDVDGAGLAGVERALEPRLRRQQDGPLQLSLDVAVQHALRDELQHAMARFEAEGAAGAVLDAHTGEVVALTSLPDFDPNHPGGTPAAARFNRMTLGVYELGSVFKIFTVAMGLDSGQVTLADGYDATHPLRVSRFLIRDDHPKRRWLSVPEIFMYSSNIGAAKMAVDVGTPMQKAFLTRLGFLRPPEIELPEVGAPLSPSPWREINTMTVAFGHGLAVTPLHLASAASAMVNGGLLHEPTLLRRTEPPADSPRVIKPATSDTMRRLLRLVVAEGTGRQADVPGYLVGGKTGTAEKAAARGYNRRALLSSFVGVFPSNAPRYVVYVLLDEPRGDKETHGFASAGWTAAPTVGAVITRVAPLLGVSPQDPAAPEIREALAVLPDGQGARLASY